MMSLTRVLPVAMALGFSSMNSAIAWAQEVTVTANQTAAILGEPVFLKVTLEANKAGDRSPAFEILLNGKPLEILSPFQGPVYNHESESGNRIHEALMVVYIGTGGYLISKPGLYTLIVQDLTSGVRSKEVKLVVKEAAGGDKEVGEALLAYYAAQRSPAERLKGLQRAVERNLGSRLARYAKYHLLQRELKDQPLIKRNTPEERAAVVRFHEDLLVRFGDLATELPRDSEWHCTTALSLVRCKTWKADAFAAKTDLLDLEKTYGKHPIFGRAIRHEMQAVDKMMR